MAKTKKEKACQSAIGFLPHKARRSTVTEIHFRTTPPHHTSAEDAVYGYPIRAVG